MRDNFTTHVAVMFAANIYTPGWCTRKLYQTVGLHWIIWCSSSLVGQLHHHCTHVARKQQQRKATFKAAAAAKPSSLPPSVRRPTSRRAMSKFAGTLSTTGESDSFLRIYAPLLRRVRFWKLYFSDSLNCISQKSHPAMSKFAAQSLTVLCSGD